MLLLEQSTTPTTDRVSVAHRTFDTGSTRGQETTMTSHSLAATRHRARGIDLLVMRVSLAMLLWARRRADRADLPREEHERRLAIQADIARRQHASALLAARVR